YSAWLPCCLPTSIPVQIRQPLLIRRTVVSTIEQRLWNSRFPTWQPRLIRLGWALVLLPTLLAFLLPDQITAGNQVVQLLYLLSPVLLAGVILIGILCLLSGYLQFFSSAWGFLLLLP